MNQSTPTSIFYETRFTEKKNIWSFEPTEKSYHQPSVTKKCPNRYKKCQEVPENNNTFHFKLKPISPKCFSSLHLTRILCINIIESSILVLSDTQPVSADNRGVILTPKKCSVWINPFTKNGRELGETLKEYTIIDAVINEHSRTHRFLSIQCRKTTAIWKYPITSHTSRDFFIFSISFIN